MWSLFKIDWLGRGTTRSGGNLTTTPHSLFAKLRLNLWIFWKLTIVTLTKATFSCPSKKRLTKQFSTAACTHSQTSTQIVTSIMLTCRSSPVEESAEVIKGQECLNQTARRSFSPILPPLILNQPYLTNSWMQHKQFPYRTPTKYSRYKFLQINILKADNIHHRSSRISRGQFSLSTPH